MLLLLLMVVVAWFGRLVDIDLQVVVIVEGRDLQLMDGRLRGRFYVGQIWRRNGVDRAILGRRR